jgi:hypothetical protein
MEEDMLRVIKNRELRKIFGHKWEGVTENWRKLHCMEHHDITKHNFGDQIKENEMGKACGTNEGEEICTQGVSGKHE